MFSNMLRFFLSHLLLLTIQTRSARSLSWDPEVHPNHKGKHHPTNWISSHLPDYPPNLPDWLSSSLTCAYAERHWDVPKLNVLYVAAHFCSYVSVPEAFHFPITYPMDLEEHRKDLPRATSLTRKWRC